MQYICIQIYIYTYIYIFAAPRDFQDVRHERHQGATTPSTLNPKTLNPKP